jgi:hypothetical protein
MSIGSLIFIAREFPDHTPYDEGVEQIPLSSAAGSFLHDRFPLGSKKSLSCFSDSQSHL